MQFLHLMVRLDPEFIDQQLAQPGVGRQRLGLPAAAIQGEHSLGVESLSQPMVLDQARGGIGNRGVVAERELGVQARLFGIDE